METFTKRQKEMRRLERQRDKVAKRMEIKARKAAGITNGSDADSSTTANTVESGGKVDPPAGFEAIHYVREPKFRGDPAPRF